MYTKYRNAHAQTSRLQIRLENWVGEQTGYPAFTKAPLYNLLHTLNPASSKQTCPYSCGHESLKCSSTAVSTASQMMKTAHHEWVDLTPGIWQSKEPSKPNTGLEALHKGLFCTIKGITLVFQHFEMLILFSTVFSSCFQHEIPRCNNKERSNKCNQWLIFNHCWTLNN